MHMPVSCQILVNQSICHLLLLLLFCLWICIQRNSYGCTQNNGVIKCFPHIRVFYETGKLVKIFYQVVILYELPVIKSNYFI